MKRIKELDFLRGITLFFALTIDFNTYINIFQGSYNPQPGIWHFLALISTGTFIILTGVSLKIRYENRKKYENPIKKYLIMRGICFFVMGTIISQISKLVFPQWNIIFGIIQFFGVCFFIAYPLLKIKSHTTIKILLILLLLTPLFTEKINWGINNYATEVLIKIGLKHPITQSLEYVPILPWLGLFYLGILSSKIIYSNIILIRLYNLTNKKISNFFMYVGKNSLNIYLLHYPLLITWAYFI